MLNRPCVLVTSNAAATTPCVSWPPPPSMGFFQCCCAPTTRLLQTALDGKADSSALAGKVDQTTYDTDKAAFQVQREGGQGRAVGTPA